MAQITFEIVTPEGPKFGEEVYSVTLPTSQGQIGILPHHIPLITIVTPGVIFIRRHQDDSEEQAEHVATAGGLVEIDGKRVRLLADSAQRAEDIDELKAKEALEHARQLQRTAKNHVDLAEAVALIDQNLARLKVAELRRRHKKSSMVV